MTFSEKLQLLQLGLSFGVAFLVWAWRKSTSYAELQRRITDIEKTLDRAGSQSSRLATEVQGMPERARAMVREELAQVWSELRHMREVVERKA